jgi:membrane protein
MIIGPLFFLISGSIAVFIKTQVTVFARQTEAFDTMNPVVAFSLNLIPYSLIWILFLLTYMIIPNIKVNWKAALYGAIFAGTLYHWVQWFYISFQYNTSKYSAVYGSFAAFPLFLIWLQISWFIVLLGAELSYAFQNIPTFIFEKKSGKINHFYKKVLSLDIMNRIIKNFENGERPHSTKQIATKTQIPENIAGEILTNLQEAGMISRVSKGKRSHAFQPARDINRITIQDVLQSLEYEGEDNRPLIGEYFRADIVARLKKFDALLKKNSQNILVKDI